MESAKSVENMKHIESIKSVKRMKSMERVQKYMADSVEEPLSLLYVRSKGQSYSRLRRAAERAWRCVRREDAVLLLGNAFLVMLPETSLTGAQVVANRIQASLLEEEYELQVVSGEAAQALIENTRIEQAAMTKRIEGPIASPPVLGPQMGRSKTLPYLAFLSNYPSLQLLQILPYELAYQHHCVPVGAERGVLTLATCQQLQAEVISHFQRITQRGIFQVRCEHEVISEILRYWQSLSMA